MEKEPELKQDRISIVYRDIATFEKDGKLFGQGAPFKSLEMEDSLKMEDSPEILKKQEQQRLMDAFCKENKESDFDWDKVYGKGFDVLDFSLLR